MSHTPGPWVLDGDNIIERTGFLGGVYIAHKDSGRVAETFVNCRVTAASECRANARLIAAAPELLEACKDALRDLIADGHEHYRVVDTLRAAIAKAEQQ
jgi:hypothetical protein